MDFEFPSAKALWQTLTMALSASRAMPEAEAEAYWLMEYYTGKNRLEIVMESPLAIDQTVRDQLRQAVVRLQAAEPIQYVLGEAWFYGRRFAVSPQVLIPRPETEELTLAVLQRLPQSPVRVLDVGTGSGCIPITLALERPTWEVHALDIAEEALALARTNAAELGATVTWHAANVLTDDLPVQGLDALVSNPPYVRHSEQRQMEDKVLKYEPHLALFVPDEDALLFYRRLARLAPQVLRPGGWLLTEINESLGAEVRALYKAVGLQNLFLHRDLQGKPRLVGGQLSVELEGKS